MRLYHGGEEGQRRSEGQREEAERKREYELRFAHIREGDRYNKKGKDSKIKERRRNPDKI